MSLLSRNTGGSVLTGLLALLLASIAGDASAQSSAKYNTRSARFTHRSPSGAATEIVEGGTYYDDGNGGLVPAGSAAARGIAGPTAGLPTKSTAGLPTKSTAGPTTKSTAGPTGRRVSRQMAAPAEELVPESTEGPMVESMLGSASDACCDDGSCGECCLEPCCPFPLLPLDNLEFFAGVQGFTGPANRVGQGSFGFNEGVNWGVPFPLFDTCMGMQFGARAVQSNLHGTEFSEDSRNQLFLSGGLFRRVDVGLQGGLVFDYLNDTWYRDANLGQLRGELSWVFDNQADFGFWFTATTRKSTTETMLTEQVTVDNVTRLRNRQFSETWEATDLYAFFYRRQLGECRDGEARVFGGFTGQSDGLVGVDARLPLTTTWSMEANFIYLIPKQGTFVGADSGASQESWNLGFNLVWVPGRAWAQCDSQYYRPLLRVADNGSFMMDRK